MANHLLGVELLQEELNVKADIAKLLIVVQAKDPANQELALTNLLLKLNLLF